VLGGTHSDGARRNRGPVFALVALAVLVGLNLAPSARGSIAFQELERPELAASRGWPFRCWTGGSGAVLGRFDGSQPWWVGCHRDVLSDSGFPHLLVHRGFLALDVLVALAFLRVAYVVGRPPRRTA
jgi:hypothetical protein